jgi:hypothetical protein
LIVVKGNIDTIRKDRFSLSTTSDPGQYIVHVSDRTRFVIPGTRHPSLVDLKVGDAVAVTGLIRPSTSDTDVSELDAKLVVVLAPGTPEPQPIRLVGKIAILGDSQFELMTSSSRYAIYVGEGTEFEIPGDDDPSFGDLEEGNPVVVIGHPRENSTSTMREIDATKIVVRRPQTIRVAGKVEEIQDTHFVLANQQNRFLIHVSESTTFKIPDDDNPTYDDLQIGDKALVIGVPRATATDPTVAPGEIDAHQVIVRHPEPNPTTISGRVETIAEDHFTLIADDTTTPPSRLNTIWVSDETRFHIPGVPHPTFADLQEGDYALVAGLQDSSSSSEIKAIKVLVRRPDQIILVGQVASIRLADSGFELALRNGEIEWINTNRSTRYVIAGVKDPTLADLQIGAKALVTVRRDPDGTLTALLIRARNPQPRPVKLEGTIAGIDDPMIKLETKEGIIEITTTPETHYRVPGIKDAKLEDLPIDAKAWIVGLAYPDGQLVAKMVTMRSAATGPTRISGQVHKKDTEAILITTKRDRVWVHINEETQFRIWGIETPGLEDVKVGDRVLVVGQWTAEKELIANTVTVIPKAWRPGRTDAAS